MDNLIETVVLEKGEITKINWREDKIVQYNEYINVILVRLNNVEQNHLCTNKENAKSIFINLIREHYNPSVTESAITFFLKERVCKNQDVTIIMSNPRIVE